MQLEVLWQYSVVGEPFVNQSDFGPDLTMIVQVIVRDN